MRVQCSYEDFTQSVIHPLEFGPHSSAHSTMRHSPVKPLVGSSTIPVGSSSPGMLATSIPSLRVPSSPETRWSVSPKLSSLLRLARPTSKGLLHQRSKKPSEMEGVLSRPRTGNVEEAMLHSQLQCKGPLWIQNTIIYLYGDSSNFALVCLFD